MRLFYLFSIFFILVGCSSRGVEYVMPTPQMRDHGVYSSKIGVAEVKIPHYLNSDKILVQKGTELYTIDAHFATIPSKLLTQNAIVALKRSLNTADVFLYPWDFQSKKGVIVTITLDNFIYKDGYAIVAGSYYIKNTKGTMLLERNFRYKKACNANSKDIVVTLSNLFNRVLEDVAANIARR